MKDYRKNNKGVSMTQNTNFEIGSQWKTRGGNRAVICDRTDRGVLLVWHSFDEFTRDHFSDGEYVRNERSHRDLIEPWKEPRK